MTKEELRKMTLPADEDHLMASSEVIQNRIMESQLYRNAARVFCYVSVKGEVSTRRLLDDALKNGKALYVPKCLKDHEMAAVRIRSLQELIESHYGIPEPVMSAERETDFDIMIIPCLAAGENGERLGHGAGYYDRFLTDASGVRICLCRQDNIREDIPMDDHDQYMDMIVTEENCYIRKAGEQ